MRVNRGEGSRTDGEDEGEAGEGDGMESTGWSIKGDCCSISMCCICVDVSNDAADTLRGGDDMVGGPKMYVSSNVATDGELRCPARTARRTEGETEGL